MTQLWSTNDEKT